MKKLVALLLFGALAWLCLAALQFWVRLRFPPRIPPELGFEHDLTSARKLREVAEILAKKFPSPVNDVVCLGVVRGNAARILFHSGPKNRTKRGNIHRFDYLLEVVREGKKMRLRLTLNRPYSSLRLRRSEMEPLVRALRSAYGDITEV